MLFIKTMKAITQWISTIGLHLVKLLLVMLVVPCGLNADRRTPGPDASFEVTFSKELRAEPVTGRVFVAITRKKAPEPRLQVGYLTGSPFFGADVSALGPGEPARVTREAVGFPFRSLDSLPAGD